MGCRANAGRPARRVYTDASYTHPPTGSSTRPGPTARTTAACATTRACRAAAAPRHPRG